MLFSFDTIKEWLHNITDLSLRFDEYNKSAVFFRRAEQYTKEPD